MKRQFAINLIALVAVSGIACTASFAEKGNCSKAECAKEKAMKESSLPLINTEDLKAGLDKVKLVDALDAKFFERSHIPGSINIPVGQAEKLASDQLPDKSADVVVYCMNTKCHAADAVADQLTALGYKSVKIYRNGIQGWLASGNTAEGSNPTQPIPEKTKTANAE